MDGQLVERFGLSAVELAVALVLIVRFWQRARGRLDQAFDKWDASLDAKARRDRGEAAVLEALLERTGEIRDACTRTERPAEDRSVQRTASAALQRPPAGGT